MGLLGWCGVDTVKPEHATDRIRHDWGTLRVLRPLVRFQAQSPGPGAFPRRKQSIQPGAVPMMGVAGVPRGSKCTATARPKERRFIEPRGARERHGASWIARLYRVRRR
jgi:hypothetical protein